MAENIPRFQDSKDLLQSTLKHKTNKAIFQQQKHYINITSV